MNDKALIKKIKLLKEIKPERKWVVLTKSQILGKEQRVELNPLSFLSFLFKPTYAISAATMLLIIGLVGFFVIQDRSSVQVAETPEPSQEMILALTGLREEINKATELLKITDQPQKILEVRNVVVPTIKVARNIISELEKAELEKNIVTNNELFAVRNSLDNLQDIQTSREAEIARNLIQDLRTRNLNQAQQEILDRAELAYTEGNYHQALIDAMLVAQIIN